MSVIEVHGLTKRFENLVAVDHLSFEVKEGEVLALLGPNGAGKTTTIRILSCLLSMSSGSARVEGYDVAEEPLKVRETVGILTENPSIYERLTAYENLDFFAEAYGLSRMREKRDRIRDLLEFFHLWERRDDKVAGFSKGMKQKLAIARTMVHRPPILFLDEPTAGLDPEAAKGIRDLIEGLSKQEKHTILLCTHHLEDAERLCSRVMIINRGRNIVIGSPKELRDKIAGQPTLQVRLKKLNQRMIRAVEEIEQVIEVDVDESILEIMVDDIASSTPEIVRRIVYAGGQVLSVNTLRPTFEEAYLKLVKGEAK